MAHNKNLLQNTTAKNIFYEFNKVMEVSKVNRFNYKNNYKMRKVFYYIKYFISCKFHIIIPFRANSVLKYLRFLYDFKH